MKRLIAVAALLAACKPAPSSHPTVVTAPAPDAGPLSPLPEPEPTPVTQTAQPQDLVFPDEPFRAQQPAPGPARPFQLPAIQTFRLKNGIAVYLVEQHTLPVVSLDLSFDGGSITDPPGKEGLASVCMAMLSEGTESLDKIAYAEALADVAASIDSSASGDTQGLSLSSLTKYLDEVFPIFVDTLRRPGFRAVDFDRMIKRRREALRQAKGAAGSIAGRVNGPILYGKQHPYGRLVTEASLDALTLDDCRAYHAKWLHPGGARLFVVGDLTEAQIRERFEGEALAGWKGKVPKMPKVPAPDGPAGRIFFVDVPGAKQSEISVMHFGPRRNAKDYFSTWIMGSVLGGGFSSRVNMNLREDKGYSYGARAGFGYSRLYGVFSGGGSVVSEATYQALIELDRELRAIQGDRPPTDDEIAREKSGAILALPGRFATASASLSTFRSLVYYGLSLDYYATFVKNLEGVTAAQVAGAARKHLRPDDAVYLVVGDGKAPVTYRDGKEDRPLMDGDRQLTLLEALAKLADDRALGAGALVVLDADAAPVAAP